MSRDQYLHLLANDIAAVFKSGELRLALSTEVLHARSDNYGNAIAVQRLLLQLLDKDGLVIVEAKGPDIT